MLTPGFVATAMWSVWMQKVSWWVCFVSTRPVVSTHNSTLTLSSPSRALLLMISCSQPLEEAHFAVPISAATCGPRLASRPGCQKVLVHDLRDTAARLAISAGASIKAVQRMLGHSSAKMTLDTYGSLFEEDLEELADRLDARFREADVAPAWPKRSEISHLPR